MEVIVAKVDSVRPHGDNLSIVKVGDFEVVASRKEDGSFRWTEGETCVYVPEGAIIPEDVLKERGYWDEEKNKGLLEGKKGNRVKMRRFAGFESRGLLFKTVTDRGDLPEGSAAISNGSTTKIVNLGDNVAEFFGITPHNPA